MTDKTKLTVQFPNETVEEIKRLADQLNTTYTEVLKRGVKLQSLLLKEEQNGRKILLHDEKNNKTSELVLL